MQQKNSAAVVPRATSSRRARAAPARPVRALPIIDVSIGDLAQLTLRGWRALREANNPPEVFRHADGLAMVVSLADGTTVIRRLDLDRLRYRLARVAQWCRPVGNQARLVAPPVAVVRDMLASPDPPVPVLKHLVSGPYVTESGELHLEPGYHADSQLYYASRQVLTIPPIPPNPTGAELQQAVSLIRDLIVDFPFVSQSDVAHAIGLLLLPLVEQQIQGAIPAHAINKPTPGSGGGLLMDVLLWPALGSPAAKMTEAGDDAEWRRVMLGKLLQGSFVIGLDNVRRPLESAALASALTEAYVEDRVIGYSHVVRVPARRIWVIVGNNLALSEEIQRRTIPIRLDPAVERPECRTGFRHPHLRRYVAEHRADLAHAALTIGQAWQAAGRPLGSRTLGSFESWAEVMGGVLAVAGVPGWLDHLDHVRRDADPREAAWRACLQLWWMTFGPREVGVSDLWRLLDKKGPDILIGLDLGSRGEHSCKSQLGLWLARNRDRVVEGVRLVAAGSVHGANRWRLVKESPAQP